MSQKAIKQAKVKAFITVASVIVIILATVTTSLAWLTSNAAPVENFFEVGKVTSKVDETFDNSCKTNVRIENTGTTDAYIRVMLIPVWKMKSTAVDGTVSYVSTALETKNTYDITFKSDSGWTQSADGYWYYSSPVAPTGYTDYLIESCTPKTVGEAGLSDEYSDMYFELTVICSAIQSTPAEAVIEAWSNTTNNLTVADGKITVTSK